jgi:hypothetical protein
MIHIFLGLLDPDPDPLVRGMYPAPNPDPSIITGKNTVVRKSMISTVLTSFFDILSLKNYVTCTFKKYYAENFFLKLVFCCRLEGQ